MSDVSLFTEPPLQPSEEGDGAVQRPEVTKEDLTQATNKLGLTGPPKSKTIQVMEECGEDTLHLTQHTGRT